MPAIAHQNKILGNTSGGGSTILVTTSESTLYGQTVTLSDGTTTLSGTFSNTGECEFTGVMMTGNLTLACSGVSQNISIPYFGNYSFVFSLFSATVNVTYPYSEGASCTLSDGTTTLIATGSPMAFTVPNAGTWTASVTLDGVSKTDTATITTDGQVASINIIFGTINVTYDNDFRGVSITCILGGTTITKTAPSAGNTMYFYPPTTGNWTISGTVSSDTFYSSPNPVVVSSLSTSVSATLETIPDGSTKTPTDDVSIWLSCAGIRDKSYTTLTEVLADSETFNALLGDSNACAYMARSTTWASGLVPTMTSDTTPSGLAFASGTYSANFKAYKAFDGTNTGEADTWAAPFVAGSSYIGYQFTSEKIVKGVRITNRIWSDQNCRVHTFKLQGSNDSTTGADGTWVDIDDTVDRGSSANASGYSTFHSFNNTTAYSWYRILILTDFTPDSITGVGMLQFYSADAVLTDNQYAMSMIGQYDVCCDALLNDNTWYSALSASTYASYVIGHIDSGEYIHGTNNESAYYLDGATQTPIVDPSTLSAGTYTFGSTVAKDPSDLTADYTKTIRITPNTKEIVLRPDNSLYWWGYESVGLQDVNTTNGWSTSYNESFVACTRTSYYIDSAASSSQEALIGSKYTVPTGDTVVFVYEGVTLRTNAAGFFGSHTSKAIVANTYIEATSNALAKATLTSNGYCWGGATDAREMKIYAFYHE